MVMVARSWIKCCCFVAAKGQNIQMSHFAIDINYFFHSCFKSHRTTCRLEILIRENLNNAEGWAVHLQTHIILIEPKKEFDISLNFNYRAPLDIEYWRSSVNKVITINVRWLPLLVILNLSGSYLTIYLVNLYLLNLPELYAAFPSRLEILYFICVVKGPSSEISLSPIYVYPSVIWELLG